MIQVIIEIAGGEINELKLGKLGVAIYEKQAYSRSVGRIRWILGFSLKKHALRRAGKARVDGFAHGILNLRNFVWPASIKLIVVIIRARKRELIDGEARIVVSDEFNIPTPPLIGWTFEECMVVCAYIRIQ